MKSNATFYFPACNSLDEFLDDVDFRSGEGEKSPSPSRAFVVLIDIDIHVYVPPANSGHLLSSTCGDYQQPQEYTGLLGIKSKIKHRDDYSME